MTPTHGGSCEVLLVDAGAGAALFVGAVFVVVVAVTGVARGELFGACGLRTTLGAFCDTFGVVGVAIDSGAAVGAGAVVG
jgi:hypothetical protein